MKAKFASSKTKLSQCLGISRQYLHEFFKLPDSPVAASNGMHSVAKWRKFIANHVAKVKGAGTEREKLQIALLRIRVSREELELAEQDHTIRESITNEIESECCKILDALTYQLCGLPMQVAPKLAGLEVKAIFKKMQAEIDSRFSAAADALKKLQRASQRKTGRSKKEEASNVIEFNRARAGN